jgi:hypothetical protein
LARDIFRETNEGTELVNLYCLRMSKSMMLLLVGAVTTIVGIFLKITRVIPSDTIQTIGAILQAVAIIWILKEKLTERKQNKI